MFVRLVVDLRHNYDQTSLRLVRYQEGCDSWGDGYYLSNCLLYIYIYKGYYMSYFL